MEITNYQTKKRQKYYRKNKKIGNQLLAGFFPGLLICRGTGTGFPPASSQAARSQFEIRIKVHGMTGDFPAVRAFSITTINDRHIDPSKELKPGTSYRFPGRIISVKEFLIREG